MAQLQPRFQFSDLPDTIPVFPLSEVLLLPGGMLPLNIFEPRYLAMVEDALRTPQRLIGMIQPLPDDGKHMGPAKLQRVGCAGRIVQFSETNDGRYLITLQGQYRFEIVEECPVTRGYRSVRADWTKFEADPDTPDCLDLDRDKLRVLMRDYLAMNDLHIDCKQLDGATDAKLVAALAMICPFDGLDKQALLEAPCCKSRAEMFMAMLEIATHGCDCAKRH